MNGETSSRRYEKSLKVPIIFSVTGHRDIPIEQREIVENKIFELFEDFRIKYSNTDLLLMTPLSDGSDRIAAHAAIRSGVKIAPILPLTEEDYKKTFGDRNDQNSVEASIKEFDEIMGNTSVTLSPCILFDKENTSVMADTDNAYRGLSAYMIANSHIMIALWDGREYSGKVSAGGTYDTVRMAYRGVDNDLWNLTNPIPPSEGGLFSTLKYLDVTEDCLIYQIETGRNSSKKSLSEKGCKDLDKVIIPGASGYLVPEMITEDELLLKKQNKKTVTFSEGSLSSEKISGRTVSMENKQIELLNEIPTYYHRIFSRIDEMNSDISVLHRKKSFEELEKEEYEELFCEYSSEMKGSPYMREMILRKLTVGGLALNFQSSSFRDIKVSIIMGVITTLFLQIYILLGPGSLIIILYILSLSLAMLLFEWHNKSKRFPKFIEYRLLAESIRVSCYWSLMGIDESVTSSCYGYMKNDMMWIRCVLTAWESYFLNDFQQVETLPYVAKRTIGNAWIESQKSYHKKKKIKNTQKAHSTKRIATTLKILSILFSTVVLILILVSWGQTAFSTAREIVIDSHVMVAMIPITELTLIQLLIIGLSVAILIVVGIEDKLIHGGTGEQIEAKYRMFDIAQSRLQMIEKTMNPDKVEEARRSVYYELGVQCINETNDWAFEHLVKDLEMPE